LAFFVGFFAGYFKGGGRTCPWRRENEGMNRFDAKNSIFEAQLGSAEGREKRREGRGDAIGWEFEVVDGGWYK
jgi:hypothetical protein